MFAQKVVQLAPYMALHLVFSLALCLFAYWTLVKWLKVLNFHWLVAIVAAVFLTVYNWGGILINMIEIHPPLAKEKAAEAPTAPSAKTPAELKADFLKAMDDLTSHPDMVKPEVRSQLFSQFASLFKSPEDKNLYYKNILRVYECQKYFLLDAEVAFQTKAIVKSQNRVDCEKADGSFFGREHLIAPEVIANNDSVVATVAKKDMTKEEHEKFSLELIEKTLGQQNVRIELTKKIFE